MPWAYLSVHEARIRRQLPADIDGFQRVGALSILNAS